MNFGTYDIEQVIWKQIAMGVTVQCKGGTKKFVKDLAKKVHEFVEEHMNDEMRQIALARGAKENHIEAYERVCKAMERNSMPFRPQDWDVYTWIVDQDKTGKTIEKFAKWARLPDNLPYINQFFKDPQNIKTQWARAFGTTETFQKNQDGSLYV